MSCVYLVSCVALKRSGPCLAKDLYISPWFKKARAYVENQGRPWFILSAQYGLLDPESMVRPYDKTLLTMRKQERMNWASGVVADISDCIECRKLVLFAGEKYREFLQGPLKARGYSITVPLKGLTIGKQLQWFGETPEMTRRRLWN